MEKPEKKDIRCSFCGKNKTDTDAIITTHSGPAICAKCLSRFKTKMDKNKQPE
ncbi:MAG: hypothetical protein DSZ28_03670 [Thiothrix sp.]|nr:MAG: hypothetical protein DSZ28_03670 [Thiothrix sp.]